VAQARHHHRARGTAVMRSPVARQLAMAVMAAACLTGAGIAARLTLAIAATLPQQTDLCTRPCLKLTVPERRAVR
jgi:hypothetical protein